MNHYNPNTFQLDFNETHDCSIENRLASAIYRAAHELMYGDESLAEEREARKRRAVENRIRLEIAIREALR